MEKIITRIVLEILGRPPEHIVSSLSMLLERLGKEKGVKIQESKTNEPIPVPESKDLYTSFAEVLLECESLETFMHLIFSYMPANIEIISPENLNFTNSDLAILSNRLVSRLHEYDSLTKGVLRERDFLISKLREFAPHLFRDYQEKKKQEASLEDKADKADKPETQTSEVSKKQKKERKEKKKK